MNLHFVKQTFEKEFAYEIVNLDTLKTVFYNNRRNLIPNELLKNKLVNLLYADDGIVHLTITSKQEPDSKVLVEDLINIIIDNNYKLMKEKSDKPEYVTGVEIKDGTFQIYFK